MKTFKINEFNEAINDAKECNSVIENAVIENVVNYASIELLKTQAINRLNKSVKLYNRNMQAYFDHIEKMRKEICDMNDKLAEAYGECVEVCELLDKHLKERA